MEILENTMRGVGSGSVSSAAEVGFANEIAKTMIRVVNHLFIFVNLSNRTKIRVNSGFKILNIAIYHQTIA